MIALGCLLTTLLASSLGDDPSLQAGKPLSIEIRAEDPVLEDHGASKRFRYVSDFDGMLHVFVLAADKDPFLCIEESDGTLLAEDDNSGGGKTPYLERSVNPGDTLTIVVALNGEGDENDSHGAVEIHLESSPETDATRNAADEGATRLKAIQSDLTLSPDASRSAIRAIVDDLTRIDGVDGAAKSRKVFDVLWRLGRAAYDLYDFATARAAWTQCRNSDERVRSPDHMLLQAVRGNLGVACERLGDLKAAKELKDLMFASLGRTLPDDHPNMQVARLQLAEILSLLGRYEEAVDLQQKALEYLSRSRAPTDALLLQARYNLAMSLGTIHGKSKELASLEAIVATLVDSLGPADLRSSKYQLYLGSWLNEAGELERSRILFESVLAALEKALPADHLQLADARAEFAITLFTIGDLDASRALFERAIATYERELPADHRDLIIARGNLGTLLRKQGDLEGARRLQADSLATLERTRSGDNPDVLTSRFQLASTLSALGHLDEALKVQEAANETWTRVRPADDPALQDLRMSLATTLERLERFDRARDLMRGVLDVRARTLRPGDPILQMTREDLLALETRQGNVASACSLAEDLAQDVSKGIASAFAALSPRETEQVALTRAHGIDRILTLAASIHDANDAAGKQRLHELAWSSIETVRSAAATSTRIVQASTKGTDSAAIAATRAAIAAAGREVTRYATLPGSHDMLVDASRRLDAAEKQLRTLLAGNIRFEPPSAKSVAAALPSNAAAVSYWRANVDVSETRFGEDTKFHLLAFVLRHGGTPTAVDLGPLSAINSAVNAWRATIGAANGRSRRIPTSADHAAKEGSTGDNEATAGEALRALVFDPLREAFGDARRIIVVPDDVLHLAPLDALPDGSGLLGDHFTIENRASLAELLTLPRAVPASGTLVLVGGIDFGDAGGTDAFAPLPGTAQEVHAIAELRRATVGAPDAASASEEIELLEGDAARKARLVELVPRARFLHLATHGEFSSTIGASARDTGFDDRVKGFAPLTLCGVALSGANAPPDPLGRRDGILTGEEIATLDLSNCELAVLSACETNVGERRPGQGVASLEAALAAAGARTIVTSLWRVPDESTRLLMTEFYRRVWVEKKPKNQALWEAKKVLRDAKDADGRPLNAVRDWAAWVLTGEPD